MRECVISMQNTLFSEAVAQALSGTGEFRVEQVLPGKTDDIFSLCRAAQADILLMEVSRVNAYTLESRLRLIDRVRGAVPRCQFVLLCDENGDPKLRGAGQLPAVYSLPVGAIIMVKDGEQVLAGDIIARKPRETSKTRDIVGGLPRVAELFEVRKPKDMAVVSEIAGTVSFAGEAKGKRKLIVTPEVGESKEYLVPKGKHITVSDGDFVECGDLLTEGNPELHDILRTKGEKYLAAYLVDEIQEVYRFQGVGIDDKHIEVIVRQMLRKVTVTEPGGTSFLVGEQVDKAEFKAENQKAMAEGRSPATAEPLVLGITQASLTTSSFISAASFQETTKVLTEAALKGKMDYLRGLKENVIVGRLIPAGTGYREYVDQDITVPDQKERPDRFLDELSGNPIIADLD